MKPNKKPSKSQDNLQKIISPKKDGRNLAQIFFQLKNYIKRVVHNEQDVANIQQLLNELKNKVQNDIVITYQANRLLNQIEKNINNKDNKSSVLSIKFLPISSKNNKTNNQHKDSHNRHNRQYSPMVRTTHFNKSPKSNARENIQGGMKNERNRRFIR